MGRLGEEPRLTAARGQASLCAAALLAIALGACQTALTGAPADSPPEQTSDSQLAEARFRLDQGLEAAGDLAGAVADYEAAAAAGNWPVSPSGAGAEDTPSAALARICEGDTPPAVVLRACSAIVSDLRFGPGRLADLLTALAEAQLDLGKPELALASVDTAQQFDSGRPRARLIRGRALEALGRDRAALSSYDRALFGEPGMAAALLARGRLLARLGITDAAEKDFDAVLSDPQAVAVHPEAYRDRALLHCRAGRPEAAAVDWQVWANLTPDGAAYLREMLEARGYLRNPASSGFGPAALAGLAAWTGEGCPEG